MKESATKFDQIKEVGGTSSPQIQKVYSTAHFLVMALRFQGLTKYLYLGRGGSFQGLYWFSKLPDPKYRIQKDRLLELFRKYFRSSRLNEIEVLETDRLFTMKCGNQYKYSNLYWFIKGSQAYASVEYQLDGNNAYYYHLWETKIQKRENAPNDFFVEFESLGLNRKEIKEYSNSNEQNISSEKEKLSWTEESYFRYLEEETKFKELSSKDKKKHLRKVENIKKDIIKIEKGLELGSLLTQDMFDIPQGHKIKLCGIKFIFNSTDNFYQKRDLIFKKFNIFRR